MTALLGILRPLQYVLDIVLRFGRVVAVGAIALMVLFILVQVFFRYVLNNALPWPDEAARFMMLWMTGLIAPLAYRRGGFVAIDLINDFLPRSASAVLNMLLLMISLLVLVVAIQLGLKHVNSGWLFNSSSLKLPLDWFGMKVMRIKLAWMYMSLLVGVILLTIVNIELIIRAVVTAMGGQDRLRPMPLADVGAD